MTATTIATNRRRSANKQTKLVKVIHDGFPKVDSALLGLAINVRMRQP